CSQAFCSQVHPSLLSGPHGWLWQCWYISQLTLYSLFFLFQFTSIVFYEYGVLIVEMLETKRQEIRGAVFVGYLVLVPN
ncbi:hypothetical protein NL495_27795, partial [Klebsiella pneumoniae]|nr:hypothetical protein [Klebsiella pneumoniae]